MAGKKVDFTFKNEVKVFRNGQLKTEYNKFHVYTDYAKCDPIEQENFKMKFEDYMKKQLECSILFHSNTSKSWEPWLAELDRKAPKCPSFSRTEVVCMVGFVITIWAILIARIF
jgi:hypothetical protein